jgi:ligand-binding sensor domain-containing protein
VVEDQELWIGSSRGLFRFSKTTALWTPVEGGEDIPVQALAQDDQGRLWLGTPRGLLYRNAAGWTREQLGDVLSLAIARGTLWIGTREGLQGWTLPQPEASLAGGARYQFTMTDSGLAADLVSCLFWRPTEEGYDLWACGPAGASRFSVTAGEVD